MSREHVMSGSSAVHHLCCKMLVWKPGKSIILQLSINTLSCSGLYFFFFTCIYILNVHTSVCFVFFCVELEEKDGKDIDL